MRVAVSSAAADAARTPPVNSAAAATANAARRFARPWEAAVVLLAMVMMLFSVFPVFDCQGDGLHLVPGEASKLGHRLGGAGDHGGVAPLAPVRLGGHVGGVGLQHQPVQGQPAEDVGGPAGVLEGDVAGEGEHPALVHQHLGILQAAGVAVEHPTDAGVGADDVQAVPVGVPVVDDGGEVELLRQGELGIEEVPGVGPQIGRASCRERV